MASFNTDLTRAVLVFVLAVGLGCAKTSISSVASPAAQTAGYKRILVSFLLSDIGLRKDGELTIQSYSDRDVTFIPSHELFLPGVQYDRSEIDSILSENQLDAELMVTVGASGATSERTPVSANSKCTSWTSSQGCTQVTTTTSGGYEINKAWASFVAQLKDGKSRRVVWSATAASGGNAFATASTLVKSMAAKTLQQLRDDGVLPQ